MTCELNEPAIGCGEQDNFYVQVSGSKRFVLASPDISGSVGLFPHTHPRHRQTVQVLESRPPRSPSKQDKPAGSHRSQRLVTVLKPGDVLFIPAFWLHTASAETESVSLALCSTSSAEEAAFALDSLPLPLESHWSAQQKATVLGHYLCTLAIVVLGSSCRAFGEALVRERFGSLLTNATTLDYLNRTELGARVMEGASDVIGSLDGPLARPVLRGCDSLPQDLPEHLQNKLQLRALEANVKLRRVKHAGVRKLILQNFAETAVTFFFDAPVLVLFLVECLLMSGPGAGQDN